MISSGKYIRSWVNGGKNDPVVRWRLSSKHGQIFQMGEILEKLGAEWN